MNQDIYRVFLDEKTIKSRIREIGSKISKDYADKNPVLITVLRGASIFSADLARNITVPVELDFMSISSYGDSTVSSGVVKIRKDIDTDICGRHVIIVEDIADSGLTLNYLIKYLQQHNPASVKTCVLLDKPEAHKVDVLIEYKGFDIGNEFVVGYGLDYAEKYRNLPYIGILKEEIFS